MSEKLDDFTKRQLENAKALGILKESREPAEETDIFEDQQDLVDLEDVTPTDEDDLFADLEDPIDDDEPQGIFGILHDDEDLEEAEEEETQVEVKGAGLFGSLTMEDKITEPTLDFGYEEERQNAADLFDLEDDEPDTVMIDDEEGLKLQNKSKSKPEEDLEEDTSILQPKPKESPERVKTQSKTLVGYVKDNPGATRATLVELYSEGEFKHAERKNIIIKVKGGYYL